MKWFVYLLLNTIWTFIFCLAFNFHDPRGQVLLVISGLIYTLIWLFVLLLARIFHIKDRRAYIVFPFIIAVFALPDKYAAIFWGGLAIASAISSLVPSARKI